MQRVIMLALATLTIGNGGAPACGRWIPQTNGIEWRICVDAQSQRYCEMKSGMRIKRMVCP